MRLAFLDLVRKYTIPWYRAEADAQKRRAIDAELERERELERDRLAAQRRAECNASVEYVDLQVDVLDTLTGAEWLRCACSWPKLKKESWDEFLHDVEFEWGENSWSCDHHRGPLTCVPCPRPLPDWAKGEFSDLQEGDWFCGESLKARIWHDGEVIFSDWPESDAQTVT